MRHLLFIVALTTLLVWPTTFCFAATDDRYSYEERKSAAESLVNRVTDGRGTNFKVVITDRKVDDKDYFALYADEGTIVLEGSDGISVASALNFYLKHYCKHSVGWCGDPNPLPEVLPLPEGKVMRSTPYRYRYYLNYCTFNYTMSWWDEERWQREIDFMALNGINMPLAVTGQNTVWQHVYRRLGFTDAELYDFFSGPAYFNWFWMGNLDGWGGPLPQSFIDRHEILQKYILRSERILGMTPVLPAFTGHVPPAFASKFPKAKVRKTTWVNFPAVTILDPEEPMFTEIGKMFIEEQTAIYDTDHFYTADTFNENVPPTKDSAYLSGMSSRVYESMLAADKNAVWVMQGWLFYHNRDFWGEEQIKALLGAVPDDRMVILDLWSERYPVWQRTNAYYGKQWIWCMLHNFGQNISLSGNLRTVATEPARALRNPEAGNLCGIGLTMEGIEQTPFIYAAMLENVWRDTPQDTDSFISDYLLCRYGSSDKKAEKAWKILASTVYENNVTNGGPESIITGRPTFDPNPGGTTNTKLHYDRKKLAKVWDLMMDCLDKFGTSDGYRYDMVDITRQIMADYASVMQQNCRKAYKSGNLQSFLTSARKFTEFLADFDYLLSSRKEFLLGRWLEQAKTMGNTPDEVALYEFNARDLLTLWGGKYCRLNDYACRQWSGLVGGFYAQRWQRFFDAAAKSMQQGAAFDNEKVIDDIREWEWNWVQGKESFPTVPQCDELQACRMIYDKYRNIIF